MRNAARFPLYSLAALAWALFLFTHFLAHTDPTAYLSRTLHLGLRDGEMRMECYDSACRSAYGYNNTFADTEEVGELLLWLRTGLGWQLFLRAAEGFPGGAEGATLWDPRVRRVTPVRLRQLRATETPCAPGPAAVFAGRTDTPAGPPPAELDTDFYRARRAKLGATTCHNVMRGAMRFETAPIPRPAHVVFGSSTSPTPTPTPTAGPVVDADLFGGVDAYQFRPECDTLERPFVHYGEFISRYPCAGHTASVENLTALSALLAANWIDEATRFVAISATYEYDEHVATEYHLVAEFGEHGGGGNAMAFSRPVRVPPQAFRRERLRPVSIVLQVLVCLHLLLWAALHARYQYHRLVTGVPDDEAAQLRPELPLAAAAVFVAVFVGVNAVLPPGSTPNVENERLEAHAIISVFYVEYMVSVAILFPLASLLSREVKTLISILQVAVSQIVYVLPFFVTFMAGFSVAGMVLFGRKAEEFSQLRWAFQTVSFVSLGGAYNIEQLQETRPVEAQAWSVIFLVAVLVTLANVFLAMVTSATERAKAVSPPVLLTERLLRFFGRPCYFGKLFVFALAWQLRWLSARVLANGPTGDAPADPLWKRLLRAAGPVRRRAPLRAVLLGNTRLWFPVETLVATLPTVRCNQLLLALHHRALSGALHGSMLTWVLENDERFRGASPIRHADEMHAALAIEERLAAIRLVAVLPAVLGCAPAAADGTSDDQAAAHVGDAAAEAAGGLAGSATGSHDGSPAEAEASDPPIVVEDGRASDGPA